MTDNILNLNEMADGLIDIAIENEWCDIEKADILWYMGDVCLDIAEIIDKKIIINDDGTIERI